MTVSIQIDDKQLNEALLKIEGIGDAPRGELAEGIGRLVQEQTRQRIEVEKISPDGQAWQPNKAGTPTLYQSGALARSVDYAASESSVVVGSGLIYAGVHQSGKTIKPKTAKALVFMLGNRLVFARKVDIPARPWLGLSADNRREIIETAEDWVGRLLQ